MPKEFFITTAIDYTNSAPHIGHAYEKILADVIARYHRLKGEKVFFLTGVDQHGQKVQQSAAKAGVPPGEFVKGIISGDLAKTIALACKPIHPVSRVEVRKSEVWAMGEIPPPSETPAVEAAAAETPSAPEAPGEEEPAGEPEPERPEPAPEELAPEELPPEDEDEL